MADPSDGLAEVAFSSGGGGHGTGGFRAWCAALFAFPLGGGPRLRRRWG